jgi:hypothetical protein
MSTRASPKLLPGKRVATSPHPVVRAGQDVAPLQARPPLFNTPKPRSSRDSHSHDSPASPPLAIAVSPPSAIAQCPPPAFAESCARRARQMLHVLRDLKLIDTDGSPPPPMESIYLDSGLLGVMARSTARPSPLLAAAHFYTLTHISSLGGFSFDLNDCRVPNSILTAGLGVERHKAYR